MSSLRNAVKRKTHKERSQPADRKKYGLLEKHKDYVLRARDFGKKRDRINNLRLKAALRNPDEFYSAMHKSKTEDGVHKVAPDPYLNHDVVHILKTQDYGYVNMKRAVDEKKAERLRENLHGLTDTPRNKHTIFVDSEKEAKEFDAAEHFDTAPELAGRAFNRPRRATLAAAPIVGAASGKDLKKAMDRRDLSYRDAAERLKRAAELRRAAEHLQAQRTLMSSKGSKRKVRDAEDGNPAVYKWKKERAK